MYTKTFSGKINHSLLLKELIAAIGDPASTGWYMNGSDGEVTFVATGGNVPDPTVTIEAHIANGGSNVPFEKWQKIKEIRSKRIFDSGVLVDGVWFHSDQEFRDVITQAMRLLPLDALPDTDPRKAAIMSELAELKETRWKTMDNQFVVPSEILAIKIDAALAVLTKRCHANGERLKAAVYTSPTPEKVELHAEWPVAYYDISH